MGNLEPITGAEGKDFNQKIVKEGVDSSILLDCLDNLSGRDMKIQVLVDSGLGKTVKGLRKHADAKVCAAAEALTAKWKDLVKSEQASKAVAKKPDAPASGGATATTTPKDKGEPKPKSPAPAAPAVPKAPASGGAGGGDKRGRIRDLLAKSLSPKGAPTDELNTLAAEIEEQLFDHFKDTGDAYTAHVKSVKFNLTDPKNTDFRTLVVSGEITPDQIPRLTSLQMAGRDKIEKKKANWDAATFQDQMFITASNLGAPSDMFECKKCKKRQCTFYQKQTRSADEPMTVFITCKNCGHEWRD